MAEDAENCISKIAAAGSITARQAGNLLREVGARAEEMRKSGEQDPFVAAAAQLGESFKNKARADRLDALRNFQKRDAIFTDIKTKGGIAKAADSLKGLLYASNKGSRENIESAWRGRTNRWQAALDYRLEQIGMKKAVISGQMDRDISEAWWKINSGEDPGSSPAAKVAKIYAEALDTLRDKLRKEGAPIGDADDYVTKTSHDPVKMRQAAGAAKSFDQAFDAWWKKVEPLVSDKSFKDIETKPGETIDDAKLRFGRSVFEATVSGVHKVSGGGVEDGFKPMAFEGSMNIARRLSKDRVLYWKDGAAWNSYMKEFGSFPTLHSSVMQSLDKGARDLSLMERLGTNPAGNLNQIIRRIQEEYRTDMEGLSKFNGQAQGIKNVMGRLDGSLNLPTNMNLAKIGSTIRTWEVMSSLGGVGVTHLVSIWPSVTSELAHHGVSRLESMGALAKAVMMFGKGAADKQAVYSDLGAYSDSLMRHQQSIYGDDTIPGRVSAMASRFLDYTGIHHIYDQTKAATRGLLAHNLARNLTKSFAELDPHLSAMLERYGIGEKEWSSLQSLKDLPVANGREYLTPSAAGEADPALVDKLSSYYSDGAAHGVVTPGVRERAILYGSTRPGDAWGEAARFFAQFKMWPLAAMHQILQRDIYLSLSKKEAAWNLGMLVAIGVPAGYMRMCANDLALGHPVRDPRDPKTLLAAAAQSGGLGILGDFLFGETSRMGAGAIATLGGPVVSDADTLIRMYNHFRNDLGPDGRHHRNGEFGDVWPDLAHFAVRHVPFANLVYLKGALDYMLWYHLYEAASPGWWERTNRRLEQEQGRSMSGYSPGGGVPFGIPYIYMKNQQGQSFGALGDTKQ